MKNNEKITEELAKQYFGKEAENYDLERTNDIRKRVILNKQKQILSDFLNNTKKGKILDVACGTGFYFDVYPQKEIYGIDISEEMLLQAKEKKKVKNVLVADAKKLPFKDETFDVVISTRFIMHTPDYEEVIKEMKRVVKKGGSIILDFPNKYSFSFLPTKIRIIKGKLRHYNFFTIHDIEEIAKKNNLNIIERKGNVIFTPNFLPSSCANISIRLNNYLENLVPKLSYVFFTHFIKK